MTRKELKQNKKEERLEKLALTSTIISIPSSIVALISGIISLIKTFKGGG